MEMQTHTVSETKQKEVIGISDVRRFMKVAKKMKKLEAEYEKYAERCPVRAARIMKCYKSKARALENYMVRRLV